MPRLECSAFDGEFGLGGTSQSSALLIGGLVKLHYLLDRIREGHGLGGRAKEVSGRYGAWFGPNRVIEHALAAARVLMLKKAAGATGELENHRDMQYTWAIAID